MNCTKPLLFCSPGTGGGGGGTPPAVFTRKAAISLTTTLTATQIANGTESDSQTITIPTWMMGRYYVYFGVPTAETDLNSLMAGGLEQFAALMQVTGDIDGYKWWRTIGRMRARISGSVFVMRP